MSVRREETEPTPAESVNWRARCRGGMTYSDCHLTVSSPAREGTNYSPRACTPGTVVGGSGQPCFAWILFTSPKA